MEEVKAKVAAMASNPRWTSQLAKEMAPSPLPRGASSLGGAASNRRKKVAPDLSNNTAFPSLADGANEKKKNRKQKAEESSDIRSSHSTANGRGMASSGGAGVYKPPMVRTTNRFSSLTDQSGRYS